MHAPYDLVMHDECLWLMEIVLTTDMLIHYITKIPYKGVDLAKEFGGKTREKQLANKMKVQYGLIKKLHGYSIHFIQD